MTSSGDIVGTEESRESVIYGLCMQDLLDTHRAI